MSEIPKIGPSELELNAIGLMPARIHIDRQNVFSIDTLFSDMSETHELSEGLQITGAIPNSITIDGFVDDDCRALYLKDDCVVLEYDRARNAGTGRVALVLARKDILETVRPIPLLTLTPVAASIDAHDIIGKFVAADDVLRSFKNIVDGA